MTQNSAILDSKILIVDDIRYNQIYISETLKSNGYTNFEFASDGKTAFDMIASYKPDLVLLDIILPDANGLDICHKIKAEPATQGTIVIMQSAISQPEQKRVAFNSGANDYINKPIEPIELVSRVRLQLEQANLTHRLKEVNNRLSHDLEEATVLLESLLPNAKDRAKICADHGVSLDIVYQPSSELGGDFVGLTKLDEERFGLYLWDFSGHGIKAALNTIRLHAMISTFEMNKSSPGNFVTAVNHNIHKISNKEFYATMFCGVINKADKTMEYSFASSPKPILISFKNDKYDLIDTKEFPVGVVEGHCYGNYKIDLSPWDALIIYSDALTETGDSNGDFLTEEGIARVVLDGYKAGKPTDAKSIKACITEKFASDYLRNISDDLTIAIVSFNN